VDVASFRILMLQMFFFRAYINNETLKTTNFQLTHKGPETILKAFLKIGQAIVKAIFIKINELNCEHVV
jgi:hypothetical protein